MGRNQKMVGNSNIYTIECFENISTSCCCQLPCRFIQNNNNKKV